MPDELPRYPLAVAREIFPPVWVVYAHPADYPGGFVVRCWFGLTPEPYGHACGSLQEARDVVRACGGCVRLERGASDPPCVAESWL